jgi:two-component system, cell cycle response regulator DivK
MPARVLIVEDNPANLDLVRYLLEAHGYATLVATEGEQGLRIALEERPELILCDLQMPVMNGYTLMRRLRADPSFRDTIVVAVTAFSMPGDRGAALAAGFHGYVSKPIDPEHFVQQIEAYLPAGLRAERPARNR